MWCAFLTRFSPIAIIKIIIIIITSHMCVPVSLAQQVLQDSTSFYLVMEHCNGECEKDGKKE